MQNATQVALVSLFAILLRWSITYHPYSGEGKPPMFGDYEAQRHWQEITFNIPVEKWYTNTKDNDLQYWGLDYPPLSAYHSFVLGYIANNLNSSYVKLQESRGLSSEDHKYFMRLSVLFVDVLVYIPSIVHFILTNPVQRKDERDEPNIFDLKKVHIDLLTMLIYPGLILIDHGHFQYNCFSLGLFVSAVTFMYKDSFIIGSILFVAALNYKQMELYHALPIFFYILGKYSPMKKSFRLYNFTMLLSISITVLSTFLVIWLPFLKNFETFKNVILRLFPVARGVFEDKVANVWCTINIIYKLRNFTNKRLAEICLLTTSFAILPNCINLYRNPQKERFLISLINCSLAFFLFSFQVHEKSILLVAVPIILHFPNNPLPCFWFLIVSHFSMLPLFIKDNLYMPYYAMLIFYYFFVRWTYPNILSNIESSNNINLKQNAHITAMQKRSKTKLKTLKSTTIFMRLKENILYYYESRIVSLDTLSTWIKPLFNSSMIGIVILSISSGFLKPPYKYPDLFSLLVSIYSFGHFILFYLYFNYKQFVHKKV